MSIWHIVTSEYPPDVGGVSDYTRQIAEGLARMGDEVHVWCPRAATEPVISRLHVHPALGRIRPEDLRRLAELLNAFPAPRRLLVQWVPHGFGYHSMNLWFCLWLAKRASAGDEIELMVHEPYLEFGRGPVRHVAMACVHRLMTVALLRSARKVWISIPAWEGRLRPYALGRRIPMQWLPIPGCVGEEAGRSAAAIRLRYAVDGQQVLGHFGSFSPAVTSLLDRRLPPLMDSAIAPSLLLLGAGGERYRDALLTRHRAWFSRVHAAGYLSQTDLAAHIAACDLFIQPYPDGITSRRTSVMACLSQGRPVVTTIGHLTEPMWAETGAVASADIGDPDGFVAAARDLLDREDTRLALGRLGRRVYLERFSVTKVVTTLRAA
jgi:glycosyltransferase involved in cell wall biosynthesis